MTGLFLYVLFRYAFAGFGSGSFLLIIRGLIALVAGITMAFIGFNAD